MMGGTCYKHGWVEGFGLGVEKSIWVSFEWRANGGEWCGWLTNTYSQASSNP
jgi:hypothetical protein